MGRLWRCHLAPCIPSLMSTRPNTGTIATSSPPQTIAITEDSSQTNNNKESAFSCSDLIRITFGASYEYTKPSICNGFCASLSLCVCVYHRTKVPPQCLKLDSLSTPDKMENGILCCVAGATWGKDPSQRHRPDKRNRDLPISTAHKIRTATPDII